MYWLSTFVSDLRNSKLCIISIIPFDCKSLRWNREMYGSKHERPLFKNVIVMGVTFHGSSSIYFAFLTLASGAVRWLILRLSVGTILLNIFGSADKMAISCELFCLTFSLFGRIPNMCCLINSVSNKILTASVAAMRNLDPTCKSRLLVWNSGGPKWEWVLLYEFKWGWDRNFYERNLIDQSILSCNWVWLLSFLEKTNWWLAGMWVYTQICSDVVDRLIMYS